MVLVRATAVHMLCRALERAEVAMAKRKGVNITGSG